ncbi:MAG: hypothetical protein B1H08_03505 [Candidatus Omnitrophica bacterium 4484_171]|nr:MAG: hypothetical protein B1H08_03505 [Candidatus Omnitrophica bacterium 4484_171]
MDRKTQSISEYAILAGLVISAFLSMRTLIKRGYQARLKGASDFATDIAGVPRQYEPYYLLENAETAANQESQERHSPGGIQYTSSASTTTNSQRITGIDSTQDDGWY